MKEDLVISADVVSRFCRLQMYLKRDIPIRASEMGALIFVQKSESAVTPLMISSFFGISKPTVSDMVGSLVGKGYLLKRQSESDKRSYTLEATEKGKALVESTYNEYFGAMELLSNKMGKNEFQLLIKLLQQANEILSEERLG